MAYGKVEETFWHDDLIRRLSEDGRNFMLYLLTSPHRNRLGMFVLDPFYAGADLQWDQPRVVAARTELEGVGRIRWDEATRVVYLTRHWKHNVLQNPASVKGAIAELQGLPQSRFLPALLADLEAYGRAHYRELVDAVRARVEKSPPASANPTNAARECGDSVIGPNDGPLFSSDSSSCSSSEAVQLQPTSTSPVDSGSPVVENSPGVQAEDEQNQQRREPPARAGRPLPRITDAELKHAALHELGLGRFVRMPEHIQVSRELQDLLQLLDRENLLAAIRGCAILRDRGECGFTKGEPYTPGVLRRWGKVWYGDGDARTERQLYDLAQDVYRTDGEKAQRDRGGLSRPRISIDDGGAAA